MRGIEGAAVEKHAFLESYDEVGESLSKRLDRFVNDPDEEAVHSLRTAIRRVEARADILPKSIRKGSEMKELLKSHRKLMKRTAKVRDIDVIRGKVARHEGPAKARLLEKIDKERREQVKDAQKVARSARKLRLPEVGSKAVTQRGLQKRFERVVGRLSKEIEELLPVVTADPGRLDELHKMRIGSKKLRYTLELVLEEGSPDIAKLEGWQDALGAIHDWDVATAYLERAGVPGSGPLLKEWSEERGREFRDFARSALGPAYHAAPPPGRRGEV